MKEMNMKKLILVLFCLVITCLINAQTMLNEKGIYELKIVEQYDSINASILYEHSLTALSDIVGSREKSKTNVDVAEKETNTIVYKGELYLGFEKVNWMCGYETFAVFTLKVRCKNGKIQYTLSVPSLHMYWSCNINTNEIIPLKEIIPNFIHKGKIYHLEKGAIHSANKIDNSMRLLQIDIVNKTKLNINDDF